MIEAAHMYFLLLSAGASVSHEHISFVTVMFLFRVSCNMVVRFHGLCPKVLITFFYRVWVTWLPFSNIRRRFSTETKLILPHNVIRCLSKENKIDCQLYAPSIAGLSQSLFLYLWDNFPWYRYRYTKLFICFYSYRFPSVMIMLNI